MSLMLFDLGVAISVVYVTFDGCRDGGSLRDSVNKTDDNGRSVTNKTVEISQLARLWRRELRYARDACEKLQAAPI